MGRPMDYDTAADAYRDTRWALPWIIEPLTGELTTRGREQAVLDIGCGTGDYIAALTVRHPGCKFSGFDLSERMADIARQRCPEASIRVGDANQRFPIPDDTVDVLICVNVLHHLTAYDRFFIESRRVGRPGSVLILVTDSREDILGRSLAKLFPETVPLNLARYPAIEELVRTASAAGLVQIGVEAVSGEIDFDARFMATIERRGISELRLIGKTPISAGSVVSGTQKAHGEKWLSRTTAIRFAIQSSSQ